MSLYCVISAVDVLSSVGLRSDNFSSSDAVVANGPKDEPDAFMLLRQLSTSTSVNDIEWNLIGTSLPSEFGLYTIFNTEQYTGSILSIVNDISQMQLLDIALQRSSLNSPDQNSLIFTLPGLSPITIDIPAASSSPFQNIGVRLKNSILTVIVDCSVIHFESIMDAPEPLRVQDSSIRIFGSQATVSSLLCDMCKDFYPGKVLHTYIQWSL